MREDQIATSLPYKVVKGVVIWYNMDNKACREGHYNKNKGEQDLASAIEIKKKNRRNVFQIIYDERKISKSEIAKRDVYKRQHISFLQNLILKESVP